jgi:RNA polymerase sigma-70 factor (ECF subfamily)
MEQHATTRRAIEAVWKLESPRVIAGLLRVVRDVGLAEEFAHDALVAALEQWPRDGTPATPGAWLMTTARRRAIDHLRRKRRGETLREEIGRGQGDGSAAGMFTDVDERLDGSIEDDLLRLIFVSCHPSLSDEAQSAITLRLVCGLTTEEIARAFVTPEPTIAQRIVRAKKTLAEVGDLMELPRGEALNDRLESVLRAIYLLYNEGYTATRSDDLMRPALCEEALRLGRVLAGLLPRESEVLGLVALMELQSSRFPARIDAKRMPVLLLEQDRGRWDELLIRRGLAALERANASRAAPGAYVLQASIAACHARARTPEVTDWREIARLYQQLAVLTGSPIVELNRAVAVSMAEGPAPGLLILDKLAADPTLANYHLLHAARADMLERAGRNGEARRGFEHAAAMTSNAQERAILLERAAKLRPTPR